MNRRTLSDATVVVLAITACTITVCAVTGVIDVLPFFKDDVKVYKEGFKDEVSAEKIDKGQFQEVEKSVETENAVIKATKFFGDWDECYTLFEVTLKNGIVAEEVTMEILGLDSIITDTEKYLGDTFRSVPVTDEETGETVFYFNVLNAYTHVVTSLQEDRDMTYYISSLCYYTNGIKHEEITDTLTMTYKPDGNVLTDVGTEYPQRQVEINGVDLNVYRVVYSDYKMEIELRYTLDEGLEPSWDNGHQIYTQVLGIGEYEEFRKENANMKLFVDDVEVDYVEPDFNGQFKPCSMGWLWPEVNQPSNEFAIHLRFDSFDYFNAQSIVLQITESDGNVFNYAFR